MKFDGNLDITSICTLLGVGLTLAGGYFTMKATIKTVLEKIAELRANAEADRKKNDERHDDNIDRMTGIELQMANECLKRDDFKDFETRLDKKLLNIEHTVGSAATKAAALIVDAMRVGANQRGDRT